MRPDLLRGIETLSGNQWRSPNDFAFDETWFVERDWNSNRLVLQAPFRKKFDETWFVERDWNSWVNPRSLCTCVWWDLICWEGLKRTDRPRAARPTCPLVWWDLICWEGLKRHRPLSPWRDQWSFDETWFVERDWNLNLFNFIEFSRNTLFDETWFVERDWNFITSLISCVCVENLFDETWFVERDWNLECRVIQQFAILEFDETWFVERDWNELTSPVYAE